MQKTLLGLMAGIGLAMFLLAITLVVLGIVSPDWLSTPRYTAVPPLHTAVPSPTSPYWFFWGPQPATPTLPPPIGSLPTIEANAPGVCGRTAPLTLVLLGVDDRQNDYEDLTRTDTIIVTRVDFQKKTAAMLSIPRDLYVPLANLNFDNRINTAFLYGELHQVEGGGIQEVKDTIELNFGIVPERYVLVNFTGVETFIDAIGGIDVAVPKDIYDPQFPNEDGGGTVVFSLAAGRQHFDGRTALRYALTRHQDHDFRRIQRQQQVIMGIRDKLLTPEILPQLPLILSSFLHLVRTDLAADEMAALACIGPQIEASNIQRLAITGEYTIPWHTFTDGSVNIPDREKIAPLIDEFLGK